MKYRKVAEVTIHQMAKGKKCPKCGNWTLHEKKPGYWYCSSCGTSAFD